jgi:hypothetical protein
VISQPRLVFFISIIYHSIALFEGYPLIRDFYSADGSYSLWTRSSFPRLKISTRVFSLPFGLVVLYLVWSDSPDPGLFNDGRVRFVAPGSKGRQDGEGTRFGLLWPGWRGRIWSSLKVMGMVRMGSRRSF